MAAQAISDAVYPFTKPNDSTLHDKLLEIPVYKWHLNADGGHAEFCGLLQLAIDKIMPEDLFWTLGLEVGMILTEKDYCLTHLCSESDEGTNMLLLAGFVYTCTRMLLSDYHGKPTKQLGVQSLMYAIDYMTKQNSYDNVHSINSQFKAAANAAKTAEGVGADESEKLEIQDMILKIKQLEELEEWLHQFDQVKEWRLQEHTWKEQEELRVLLAKEQMDLLLEELLGDVAKVKSQPEWLEDLHAMRVRDLALLLLLLLMLLPLLGLVLVLVLPVLLVLSIQLVLLAIQLKVPLLLLLQLQLELFLPLFKVLLLLPWWMLWRLSIWLLHLQPLPPPPPSPLPPPPPLGPTLFWSFRWRFEWKWEQLQLLEQRLWVWLHWGKQPPLWWMEERLWSRLAMHQLVINRMQAMADKWQDLEAEVFQTEQQLFEGLEQQIQSMQTQLAELKDLLAKKEQEE